jgi:hypothetical protein
MPEHPKRWQCQKIAAGIEANRRHQKSRTITHRRRYEKLPDDENANGMK